MRNAVTNRTTAAASPIPSTAAAAVAAAAASPRPSHDAIAKRAYEIWAGNGYPSNTETQNWLEAERQLVTEIQSSPATSRRRSSTH